MYKDLFERKNMGKFLATKGRYFTVDEVDYDLAINHTWSCDGEYFVTRINGKREFLHLIILKRKGFKLRKGLVGDHIDTDTSNHNRDNLRLTTHKQSSANRNLFATNTTGLKGLTYDKLSKKWGAKIAVNYKQYRLVYCCCQYNAACAYDLAVTLVRVDPQDREFNFPENREKYLEELKTNNIKGIYDLKNYLKKRLK